MKYAKFFELAKQAGIQEAELYVASSYSLSISLFHSEIDNYSVEEGSTFVARGIINGKFGEAQSDVFDNAKAKYLVDEIVRNAKIIENDDPAILFKGSEKYRKMSTFNSELAKIPVENKLQMLYDFEKKLKEIDKRVIEIQGVEYSESSETVTLINSHGLNLTQKSNYFVVAGGVLAKEGEQVKSGFEVFLDNDYSKLNIDQVANEAVKKAISQLGGEACKSSTYKAILAPEVISSFVQIYMSHASSESVQKQSSLFIGKIGQKVASRKVTIEDKPLQRGSVYTRWFDDEGVATYNKHIVKNGVLQGYLYNLTTAAKDGATSTGNGFKGGAKIGVSPLCLVLKPGKKSFDELVKEVGNGVYITSVQGIHAGMNPQSGNFSLQSEGFLIENGKVTRGLDVITVSGNLVKLFNDIIEVGSDTKTLLGGTTVSSVVVKSISVGGK